jgi:hypothetical protein
VSLDFPIESLSGTRPSPNGASDTQYQLLCRTLQTIGRLADTNGVNDGWPNKPIDATLFLLSLKPEGSSGNRVGGTRPLKGAGRGV